MPGTARRDPAATDGRDHFAGKRPLYCQAAALLVSLMSLPHPDWIAFAVAVAAGAELVSWELRASLTRRSDTGPSRPNLHCSCSVVAFAANARGV